jgi:pimeloyl-ACP methyl ester carboxylesterase
VFYAPFALPLTWLVGLASLALLGGGVYVLWQWYVGALVGTAWLIGGVAMTLWTFVGRWIVLLFRRAGSDEPRDLQPDTVLRLPRPDGTTLSVASYGQPDAPVLVLTHGAGTNASSWYYIQRALSDRFRVVTWDMPGLGKSSKAGHGDYSLERHARDLEAVIDAVSQDGRVVLVGHSMGGMVTLMLCRLFPELLGSKVRGVVLVGSSHTNPVRTTTASGVMTALQKPLLQPLLHMTTWLAPLAWLMSCIGYMNGSSHVLGMLLGFAGTETRGQLDRATFYNVLAWPGVQARETLAMFRYDATPLLPALPIPVLCVTGQLDRLIVPETSRYILAHVPEGRVEQLKPAGHMAVFERHAELSNMIEQFAGRAFHADGTTTTRAERLAV